MDFLVSILICVGIIFLIVVCVGASVIFNAPALPGIIPIFIQKVFVTIIRAYMLFQTSTWNIIIQGQSVFANIT